MRKCVHYCDDLIVKMTSYICTHPSCHLEEVPIINHIIYNPNHLTLNITYCYTKTNQLLRGDIFVKYILIIFCIYILFSHISILLKCLNWYVHWHVLAEVMSKMSEHVATLEFTIQIIQP